MTRFRDVFLEVDYRTFEKDGYLPQVRGEDTVILAHLHCLPSIVQFFYLLLAQDLSIPSRQVIFIPKPYSTIPGAATEVEKLGVTVIQTSAQFLPGAYDSAASVHLKDGCKAALQVCRDVVK